MTSDALVAMIERKLEAYGLEKVVPDEDLLAETYRAFHRSQRLRERFEEMEQQFDKEADAADIPEDLEERVRAVLAEHADLRWDDAIQVVLDETQLSRVRAEKEKAKQKSGDFTSGDAGRPRMSGTSELRIEVAWFANGGEEGKPARGTPETLTWTDIVSTALEN